MDRIPHTKTNSGYEAASNRLENDHKSCFLSDIKVGGSLPVDGVSAIEKVARIVVLLSCSRSVLRGQGVTSPYLGIRLSTQFQSGIEGKQLGHHQFNLLFEGKVPLVCFVPLCCPL